MGEQTAISWTSHTFNPLMGCAKVSAGCTNCYAETLTTNRMGLSLWGKDGERRRTSASTWNNPRKWARAAERDGVRRRVFCASLCDVFEDHPVADAARPDLWRLIAETPALDWQLLTKRPERIMDCLPESWGAGWPHVWLGTSIEDERVVERADHLCGVPACVRFVSYEPALGPLAHVLNLDGINWLIYGGESGSGFRPDRREWADDMLAACRRAGTAFFFKQRAASRPGQSEGGPMVREWPRAREAKT